MRHFQHNEVRLHHACRLTESPYNRRFEQCRSCFKILPTVDSTNLKYTNLCTGEYDIWLVIRPCNHLDEPTWHCNHCWCEFYVDCRNHVGYKFFDDRILQEERNALAAESEVNDHHKNKRPVPGSSNTNMQAVYGTDSSKILKQHILAHAHTRYHMLAHTCAC